MGKQVFRRWDVDQGDLFPPAFSDLVPPDHLVHFIRKIIAEDLDLSEIYAAYRSSKGQPPYHPGLMTALQQSGEYVGVDLLGRLVVRLRLEQLGGALAQVQRDLAVARAERRAADPDEPARGRQQVEGV